MAAAAASVIMHSVVVVVVVPAAAAASSSVYVRVLLKIYVCITGGHQTTNNVPNWWQNMVCVWKISMILLFTQIPYGWLAGWLAGLGAHSTQSGSAEGFLRHSALFFVYVRYVHITFIFALGSTFIIYILVGLVWFWLWARFSQQLKHHTPYAQTINKNRRRYTSFGCNIFVIYIYAVCCVCLQR